MLYEFEGRKFVIIWEGEEIDECHTLDEARRLVKEYRMAFGYGRFSIRRS